MRRHPLARHLLNSCSALNRTYQRSGADWTRWDQAVKVQRPAVMVQRPAVKVEGPAVRVQGPAVRVDRPAVRVDRPAGRV